MKALRIFIAGLFASAVIVLGGISAQAVTGGNLTNSCQSWHRSAIKAYYSSTQYLWVEDCHTTKGTSIAGKVQGFTIQSNCVGRSQYTPAGAASPYKGGVYYPYSQNNLDLVITVACYF